MPKTIAIFADGTGSAFADHESNVWRLYQALDRSQPDQIAQYIKGVGTSGVRILALIDGATGIGVPSNVRKLYRFLCSNWSEGDQIVMFGFSRGAFTIRSLVGLIDKEGLVPREIDREPVANAEMRRNVAAAWRSYRRKTVPWNTSLPTIWVARAIRDAALFAFHTLLRHRSYADVRRETSAQKRRTVPIKFVGLFDTVEAFGVPVEELRAAIDWAIWPTSFRNRVLSANVESARHALCLDDERTTFHPIRFDMTDEKTDRIREVWFAGVHSDVGGGYPDASLAYVPLHWMAEEAQRATVDSDGRKTGGLRFAPDALDGFRDAASALGPMHDLRAGLAVLYRYEPRPIGEDRASGGPPVIHRSVAEKMVFGSENYAPITLPSTAMVLLPGGAKHRIAGFSARAALTSERAVDPDLARALEAVDALSAPDGKLAALTLDTVWWRRVAYYALLVSVLLAASLPITAYPLTTAFKSSVGALFSLVGLGSWWDTHWGSLAGANEGIGANLGDISKRVGGFLPGYASYWTDVAVARPLTTAAVLMIVLTLYQANSTLRDLICDRARLAWFFAGRRAPPGLKTPGLLMRLARVLRKSAAAGMLHRATTRFVLPGFALIAIFAAGAVALSRATVGYREARGGGDFCKNSEVLQAVSETPRQAATEFSIHLLCWASGFQVQKGRHYLLSIEMTHPFFDRTSATDIAGFRASSLNYLSGLPIRRWWSADWFQPIARIGAGGNVAWPLAAVDGAEAVQLGFDPDGNKLPRDEAEAASSPSGWCERIPEGDDPAASKKPGAPHLRKTYVSQFTAPESGELFLYLNDAIAAVPFGPTVTCFYDNNSGSTKVVIESVPAPRLEGGHSKLSD